MPFKIEPSIIESQIKVTFYNPNRSIKHKCVMSVESWIALYDLSRPEAKAFWAMHNITEEDFKEPDVLRGEMILPLEL